MIFRRTSYKDQPFTTIPNDLLRGSAGAKASQRRADALTAESLGVLVYLLSHDESWKVTNTQLSNVFAMTKNKVTKICRELETAGYAIRNLERNEKGQMLGWDWTIFDNRNQINENPDLGKPDVEIAELRKTITKEKPSIKETSSQANHFESRAPIGVKSSSWDKWWAYRVKKAHGKFPSKRMVDNGVNQFLLLVRERFDVDAVIDFSIKNGWHQLGDPSWKSVHRFHVGKRDELLGAVK